MKNKIKLKRYLLRTLIVSVCLLFLFLLMNIYEYRTYTRNFNSKISGIVSALQEQYPKLTKNEIIKILNSDKNDSTELFGKYGIDIDNESIILDNDKQFHKFLIINISAMVFAFFVLVTVFLNYDKDKEREINDITKCIQQINKRNYELNIDSISEDELSILKNEIYKTTVMLKEAALNSNLDKINLKKSLEDISHQIKTPLTSILIMLDDLIDDPDMDADVRNDFIRHIKREVVNINFLIQAILKLSKFDSNTIHFIKKDTNVVDIIDEAIKNVSIICDLRNITIEKSGTGNGKINCDFKWQVEAITNILKNCIEHSKDNQKIIIKYNQSNVYSMIQIKDFGEGISKKDIKHIFERFYKGENASSDSVGIGLALSKTIIQEDNGNISVESDQNGSIFTIKYYKL
ncbi:MAG: HAMP domain-containing histidine kinase [Clostridium sp.]|nr:HAMP domain-containing histidine kinase [Clostridium sp.]